MGVGAVTLARLIPLATEFDKLVGAGADIVASDLALTQNGILRVTVSLSKGAVFKLKLTRGATTKVLEYNGGNPLAADALYTFDAEVRADDGVNFQHSGTGVTVNLLNASEIIAMGP